MSLNTPVRRIAIVGTGVIGASWAAYYLSRGFVPIADNVVDWLGTTGILAALSRRAIEGGSYRVVVSLTRTVVLPRTPGAFRTVLVPRGSSKPQWLHEV